MEEIIASYSQDDKAKELLQELVVRPPANSQYQLVQGLLRYKGCIWVGNNLELQENFFSAFHDSPLGGHSGFPVTYHRIHSLFRWIGMKKFIKDRV